MRVFFCFSLLFTIAAAGRILVILPSAAIDFHKFYRAIVHRLAESHELVVVTSQPLGFESRNMTVYELPTLRRIWDQGVKALVNNYPFTHFYRMAQLHYDTTHHILTDPSVQEAFDPEKQKYDAVAVEFFGQSPLYAMARRFNCPLIGLAPNDEIDHEAVGNMWNYYQYPHPGFRLYGQLPPIIGVYAVWGGLAKRWFIDWPATAAMDRLIVDYFGNQIATTKDLSQNVDLVIMDAPPAIDFARPVVPVTQQLGFFHIDRQLEPLPDDVKQFLNDSQHGVIYANFNSELMSRPFVLDIDRVAQELTSIRATSYDVLCNWDGGMPPPVKGVKFIRNVSQQSILAHPKVLLFMAEPTIRNMEEAIWYKKPMTSIKPTFERNLNQRHLDWSGFGIALYWWDKTHQDIVWKITGTLSSKRYRQEAARLSAIVKDNNMTSVDTAAWWVAYTLRHKGNKLLRYTRGKNFNFFQYYMIDVFVTFGLLVILAVATICGLLYMIYRKSTIARSFVGRALSVVRVFVDLIPIRIEINHDTRKKKE